MTYLSCPRCGLAVRVRAPYLTMEHCPRCLARHRRVIDLEVTDAPAADWALARMGRTAVAVDRQPRR